MTVHDEMVGNASLLPILRAKGEFMNTIYVKHIALLFAGLACLAAMSLAQAGTQPSVTVKTYGQHMGENIIYNYRVTNLGTTPLTEVNIGCICPNDFTGNSPDPVPQLVISPVNDDTGPNGGVSAGSYSAPYGWKGHIVYYDEISYFSFKFAPPIGSGISLLPGQTGNFSITVPEEDKRGDFRSQYASSPEGAAYYYEMNRRGYLTGNFSYFDEDTDGKVKDFSYPMQLIDTTPPTLSVTLSPATLWPPNDKLVSVTAAITVKDDYDPNPEIKLESITASEALAAGDVQGATVGTDVRQFSLMATRAGNNLAGRIYTITYSATDASGNKSIASATVTVPHDQGKK